MALLLVPSPRSISAFIALSMIITACRKEEAEPTVEHHLSNATQAYAFHTGTYWVYEDTATAMTDSVCIVSTESGTVWNPPPIHGAAGAKHDFYNVIMESSYTGLTFNDYLIGGVIRRDGGGEYGQYGQPIWMETQHVPYGFNGMEVVAFHPQLIVRGGTFTQVTETHVVAADQYQHAFDQDMAFFFVPNGVHMPTWTPTAEGATANQSPWPCAGSSPTCR